MRSIAREIDVPQPREKIRKIFPRSELEGILKEKSFSGYFANKKHVEGLKTMDEIFYGFMFNYENTPFSLTDDFYLAYDSAVSKTDRKKCIFRLEMKGIRQQDWALPEAKKAYSRNIN